MLTREETWQRLVELGGVSGRMPDGLWNFAGVDLTLVDLSKTNFSNAYLPGAFLAGANLSGANLSGANLRASFLVGTNLSGTNLKDANLRDADLLMANLRGADLSGANLGRADLSNADLSNTNLCGAILDGVNFKEATLIKADLSNSFMIDTNFNYTDLSGSSIVGSFFLGCSTYKWKIEEIKADYLYLTDDRWNKEKHKRLFPSTRFEDLYKYMPTIELVFQGVLDIKDILVLSEIVEEIKANNKELGAEMVGTSKKSEYTHIELRAKDEKSLETLEKITKERVDNVIEHGYKAKKLARQISGLLPGEISLANAVEKMPDGAVIYLTVNDYHIEEGGQLIVNPHAKEMSFNTGDTYNITYNQQPERYDELFKSMIILLEKDKIENRYAMKELGDRLVDAIKTGKEKGIAQDIFDQFSSGVRTSASLIKVCETIAKLAGFGLPF